MKLPDEICNEIFEGIDIDTKRWIICILTELDAAKKKHPDWPSDSIHGAAIVAEESGELVRASLNYRYEKGRFFDMHKEAIQTGATAIRFLQGLPEKQLPE
jgi:hypothetical protein